MCSNSSNMLSYLLWTLAVMAATVSADDESRIIGGFEALQINTNHQVSVRLKFLEDREFGRGHICGGSLISDRLVLTAAHCLFDSLGLPLSAEHYVVVGGNTDRLTLTRNTFISRVHKVVFHEGYNDELSTNDIALLHLSEVVPPEHPTLRPIAMAEQSPMAGSSCQVSGWGTTIWGVQESTVKLMAVNISIVATSICNDTDSYNGEIAPGMLCAGQLEGGKDSCQGDSGGPLVCQSLLAGVVSFGYECGLPKFPGIYSDVVYYKQWIRSNSSADRQHTISLGLAAILFVPLALFRM